MTEIRVMLSELDFANLVRGKIVKKEGSPISIALEHIGWDRMYFQIERAMRDKGEGDLL
jgi:hypothetical protein